MIQDHVETIVARLRKHALSYPAKILYTILSSDGGTRDITYGEFHSLCEDIACLLTVQGAAKTRVILMYQDPLHFLLAFFGCLMAGCIAVPVSPPGKRKSLDSLRGTIADCEARFLLSDRATLGALEQQLADTSVKCIFTELASPESSASAELIFPEIEPSDIAFLQYTSGSTGDPKGVMVSHGNLMANEAMIQEIVGSAGDDATVSWLPLFHDMGLIGGALHPLYTGTRGVLLTPVHFLQNPFSWLQAISDYDATVSVAPNFAFDLCVRKIPEEKRKTLELSRWRVAICGAEPIQQEVVEDFISAYANQGFRREAFVASYGLAESTLYVTSTGRSGLRFLRFDKQSLEKQRPELVRSEAAEAAEAGVALCSNGKACQGSQVRIVDPDTGQPCPAGAIGEIWVSGAHVAQGYWGKQELTRQAFQARLDGDSLGYLRTGDLGAIVDGQLYVTGRLKDLIIVDGRNLYPQDIEAFVVSLHPAHGKNSTAVFAVPDGASFRLVVIQEVERMHRKRFALKEAAIEVKRRIADEFSVGVQDIVYIRQGHLPKTSSGKVQRGKAKAMYHDSLFETYQSEIEAEAAANPSDGVPAQAAHKVADTDTPPSYQHIVGKIVTKLAATCKLEAGAIDVDRPFHDYGLSSVDGTVLTGELSREFGVTVDPTEIYDYPTARRLAEHVLRRASRSEVEPFVIAPAYQADGGTKLAVIGVACRFPGAGNKDAFWENLLAGVSSVSRPSAHQARRHYQPASAVAGFVDDVDLFDAAYFNISPKEARVMDPQQRFLLQTVVHALNDAGIPQGALVGTRTGVAVGVSGSDYGRALFASANRADYLAPLGNAQSIAANRVSYFLGVHGPSLAVDTACSSSLVAVALAADAILSQRADLFIVGGVNLLLDGAITDCFDAAGMLAKDGACKVFDRDANGYVRGEGCGVVILKRLADAQRDGDFIHATIDGWAVNHDGASNGITAPNGESQQAVIREALRRAGLPPQRISVLEAHGTGTELGDPIEVNAAANVLLQARASDSTCYLGSVKASIGHLESAAGIAGLIKAVLIVQRRMVPPQVNFKSLNPHIGELGRRFMVPHAPSVLPDNQDLHIGVSSFGFGGTNAHVIVSACGSDKADGIECPLQSDHPVLLPLSAKSQNSLRMSAGDLAAWLPNAGIDIGRVAANLARGRDHHAWRVAVLGANAAEISQQLKAIADGGSELMRTGGKAPCVAYLFSGQGGRLEGVAKSLYRQMPVFRAVIDRCSALIEHELPVPLSSLIVEGERYQDQLSHPACTQTLTVAVQYALYELWQHAGVRPTVLVGHSLGEYAAAIASGIFSLEDGLKLVARRGHLMAALPEPGGMLAVGAGADTVAALLRAAGSSAAIAVINSKRQVVVAGTADELRSFQNFCRTRATTSTPLAVTCAFHSRLLEPMVEAFSQAAQNLAYGPPTLPMISSIAPDGDPGQFSAPAYWITHLTRTVDFCGALERLAVTEPDICLEIGPGSVAAKLAQSVIGGQRRFFSSLDEHEDSYRHFLHTFGRLYACSVPMDWSLPYPQKTQVRSLPLYCFDTQSYWYEEGESKTEKEEIFMKDDSAALADQLDSTEIVSLWLREFVGKLLHRSASEIDPHAPLLELGVDSVVILETANAVENRYQVKIGVRTFFEELTSIHFLALYIAQHSAVAILPAPEIKSAAVEAPTTQLESLQTSAHASLALVKDVFAQQMQLMNQQIQLLQGHLNQPPTPFAQAETPHASSRVSATVPIAEARKPQAPAQGSPVARAPQAAPVAGRAGTAQKQRYSAQQADYLDRFIASYNQRHEKSKRQIVKDRKFVADIRHSTGFRSELKEIVYPIVGDRSQGARVVDIDGNEYVDLALGMGVHFFGHNPPFVMRALETQMRRGMHLGVYSDLAGDVAAMIRQLTGMERCAFCNSGTEAVMTALRLARAATGRSKVAMFSVAYHGHSDGTLMINRRTPEGNRSAPWTLGVPLSYAEDTVVLEYGQQSALDAIERHHDQLAAVIVEPVQSRNPGLQPRGFLQSLQALAKAHGIALIFDEVITGFRIGTGGAKAWFGIEPDLVTYGKLIGGGMPVGLVAGGERFMRFIDGGAWEFGDDSAPDSELAFAAGTFRKHPLAMASVKAVLEEIIRGGERMYERVNGNAERLIERINRFFAEHRFPIKVDGFGSLFRFAQNGNTSYLYQPLEMDLFFYHLVQNGVYMWEGRTCFLSTEHGEQELEAIYQAVVSSATALREGGFFPLAPDSPPSGGPHGETEQGALAPSERSAALSRAQQQLLALSETTADGTQAYNVSITLDIGGDTVNPDRLKQSIFAVARRHEAMRSIIVDNTQIVLGEQALPKLECLNFTDRPLDASGWFAHRNTRGFALDKPPLIRFSLLTMAPKQYKFVVTAHHIFFDGWSIGVCIDEILKTYRARQSGVALALSAPMQFIDYQQCSAQHVLANGEAEFAFWNKALPASIPVLALPLANSGGGANGGSYKGRRVTRTIDGDRYRQIKAAAVANSCTLYIYLFAVFAGYLHRMSAQRTILLGTPVSGRAGFAQAESVVGYCSHLLPLHSQITPGASMKEFIRAFRTQVLEAMEHQNYPYADLLDRLKAERRLNDVEIIQTVFNMERTVKATAIDGLTIAIATPEVGYAPFGISCNVTDTGDSFIVDLDAQEDVFDADALTRMQTYLQHFQDACLSDDSADLFGLPVLPAEERQILARFQQGEVVRYAGADNIVACIADQARHTPHSLAVSYADPERTRSLSYAELEQSANRIAHYLLERGAGPEQPVGVFMDRSLELPAVLLGILKAGAAYVPIDVSLPQSRIDYILRDCRAGVVVTQSWLLARLGDEPACEPLLIDDPESHGLARFPIQTPQAEIGREQLAYIIYTSGSTGEPKGVMVPHQGVLNRLQWMQAEYGLDAGDTVLQKTPYSFDVSVWEFFWPLMFGARLLLAKPEGHKDPAYLIELIEAQQVTTIHFVPSMLNAFLQTPDVSRCRSLIRLFCSGEALSKATEQLCLARLPDTELHNLYGPTEASVDVSYWRCDAAADFRTVPIGRPIANTRLYVLDANLNACPVGAVGELYISGVCLARGYLNRDDLTRTAFLDNPHWRGDAEDTGYERLYKTGDLACYLGDGNIEYLGRRDQQVKVRGFRVELEEIEAALRGQIAVRDAAVLAVEHAGSTALHAYVVADLAAANTLPTSTEQERVGEWSKIFDDMYRDTAAAEETFDIVGWDSSYTLEPLPAQEMREWLDTTVARIRQTQPRHVLEIGVGTGLLLFPLAAFCESYRGFDVSASVIAKLQETCERRKLGHVRLLQGEASAAHCEGGPAPDTIILNSVAQYFPSRDYLQAVLERCLDLLADGGRIFVGDVRHYDLLDLFHGSVAIHQADGTHGISRVRELAKRRVNEDGELSVSPHYFLGFLQDHPAVTRLDIMLKEGAADNELTKYRYDVIVEAKGRQPRAAAAHAADTVDVIRLPWRTLGTQEVARQLQSLRAARSPLFVEAAPNPRLAHDSACHQLLSESNCINAGQLREQLRRRASEDALSALPLPDIPTLQRLAAEHGYTVSFSFNLIEPACIDLLFAPQGTTLAIHALQTRPARYAVTSTSDPARSHLARHLLPLWREGLGAKLPEYMVPSRFVLLTTLPTTANGKLDRKTLRELDSGALSSGAYIPPVSAPEKQLAEIWQKLLGCDRVSMRDNFFEIGGDSILSLQLIAICAEQGIHFTARQLFENKTIERLLQALADDGAAAKPAAQAVGEEQDADAALSLSAADMVVLDDQLTHYRTDLERALSSKALMRLSPLQQGMLYHYRMAPEDEQYIEQVRLGFAQALSIDALRDAWRTVCGSHAALRTRIFWRGLSQPLQCVLDVDGSGVAAFEHIRVSGTVDRQAQMRRERSRGFDLEKEALIRLTVIDSSEEPGCHLLWTFHHIILDAWSINILSEEFFRLYLHKLQGGILQAAAESFRYGDYLRELRGNDRDRQQRFWRDYLRSVETPCLLLEHPAREAGAHVRQAMGRFSPHHVQDILQAARKLGVQVNVLLQAAWSLLLSLYVGNERVTYGLSVSGRSQVMEQRDKAVGLFINTVPVHIDLAPLATLGDVVQAMNGNLQAVLEHEGTALSDIQACAPGGLGQNLFDCLVVVENTPKVGSAQLKTAFAPEEIEFFEKTNYPFELSIHVDETIEYVAIFDRQRLAPAMVERLLEQFRRVVVLVGLSPEMPRAELALVAGAEARMLQELGCGTARTLSPADGVLQRFARHCQATPQRVAVEYRDTSLTYAQLDDAATRLAGVIRQSAVDSVGIYLPRSIQMVVAVLASIKAGTAFIPIDASLPAARIAYILADADVGLLIADGAAPPLPSPAAGHRAPPTVIDINGQFIAHAQADATRPGVAVAPSDNERNVYTIYTSGSTGQPKGVQVRAAALDNFLLGMDEVVNLDCHSRLLAVTAISFDIAYLELLLPLVNGATVVVAEQAVALDGRALSKALQERGISHMQATPTTWRMLLAAGCPTLRNLKALVGGDTLSVGLANQLRERVDCLINLYGPTETTIWSSSYRIDTAQEGSVPIGRAILNTQLYVLDGQQRLTPWGRIGELYIGGAGLALGYAGRADLTAERFVQVALPGTAPQRLYRTGDRVRYRADGNLEYIGRSDNQIKLNGYRIELGEIEAALNAHPDIAESCVLLDGGEGQAKLLAYLLCASAQAARSMDLAALHRHLSTLLPRYMWPSQVHVCNDFPLNTNRKTDRKALLNRVRNAAGTHAENVGVAAESPMQRLWERVLKQAPIAADADFFSLGGNSMLAMELLQAVEAQYAVHVGVTDFFAAPTVTGLMRHVSAGSAAAPAVDARERGGPVPVNPAQRRIWLEQTLLPYSSAHNITSVVTLTGKLSPSKMLSAIDHAIAANEAFGLVFSEGEEGIVQEYQVSAVPRASFVDWPANDFLAGGEWLPERMAASSFVRRYLDWKFDLRRGPLAVVDLVKVGADRHLLCFTAHHLVFDGWSANVLLSQIVARYQDADLKPLTADTGFINYLREQPSRSVDHAAGLRFWSDWLRGVTPFPLGAPATVMQDNDAQDNGKSGNESCTAGFAFDGATTAALHDFARRRKTSLFVVLMAAYQAFLARLGGETGFAVATPVANRKSRTARNIVGCLINTLIIPADFTLDEDFAGIVDRLHEKLRQAHAYDDVPYEEVLQTLGGRAGAWVNTLFTLEAESAAEDIHIPGLLVRELELRATQAKFDLECFVVEEQRGLRGGFHYRSRAFQQEIMEDWAVCFQHFVQNAIAGEQRPLGLLDMVAQAPRERLLHDWNRTAREFDGDCTLALIEQRVKSHPDAVAVVFQGERLSYAQLNGRANQLARHLIERGVESGSFVGMCLRRSPWMPLAILAIWKAGAAYVPLDPDYPTSRLEYLLRDSAAALVLTQTAWLGKLTAAGGVIDLDADHAAWETLDADDLPGPGDGDSLAYMLYTSGSTGQPKGVMVGHRALANRLHWMQAAYPIDGGDVVLQKTPYTFDVSVWEFIWPLLQGATLCIARPDGHKDPEYLLDLIAAERVTTLHFVPSMLEIFLQADDLGRCAGIRRIFCSGEALQKSLELNCLRRLPHVLLVNLYGPTEAAIDVSHWVCDGDQESTRVPIGRPIANIRLYVLDVRQQLLPPGAAGELCIGGVGLAQGYRNLPELTREKFIADPYSGNPGDRLYRTGDLARFLHDGNIEYLCRLDDQIKLRGQRIEPGEIVACINTLPGVRESAVLAPIDARGQQQLVAYYVSDTGLDQQSMRDHLLHRLPDYMVPAVWVNLPALPLSRNGKLDKGALPQPSEALLARPPYQAPRSEEERVLADIWSAVLGVQKPGVRDNFFASGGDSIKAMQVASRLRKALNTEVELRWVFQVADLGAMAALLARRSGRHAPVALSSRRSCEAPIPLSHAQKRLWFLSEMEPDDSFYNMAFAFELKDADIERLKRAMLIVVNRHEALRTNISLDEQGIPIQLIRPPLTVWPLQTIDADEEALGRTIAGLVDARFDFRNDPLMKNYLVRLPQRQVVLTVIHHIIFDGWSIEIFKNEVLKYYRILGQADAESRLVSDPPLSIQYADYSIWQNAVLDSDLIQLEIAFWKQQLEGYGGFQLPLDFPRPAEMNYRGDRFPVVIAPDLVAKVDAYIQERASEGGVTAFVCLLAAYQLLMYQYSGNRDICIGTPTANRVSEELEALIGFFVNMLALRSKINPEATFDEFVAQVGASCLSAQQYQNLPFEMLIDELGMTRDIDRHPLFQHVFVLQTTAELTGNVSDEGLETQLGLHELEIERHKTLFDTRMELTRDGKRISGHFEYAATLFTRDSMETLCRRYQALLEQLLSSPRVPLKQVFARMSGFSPTNKIPFLKKDLFL